MKFFLKLYSTIMISLFLCSCSAIEGIFKAGMGFGIFIVIAVIIGIVIMITRSGKK